MSILKTFLFQSNLHGLRFLEGKEYHWSEKLFWFICLVMSWIGSTFLIVASLNDFYHNAISFVVETDYLNWDTQFPSITVCEYDNQKNIAEVTDKLFGDPHDYNLDEIVKELVYFRGLSYYTLQVCGPGSEPNVHCLKNNFSSYSLLVRNDCKKTFKSCKWNNKEFDCCKYFVPEDTELGLCFALNSVQSRVKNYKTYPMISNKKEGPGSLTLELFGFVNMYILGEQEVPSLTTLQTDILQVSPHISYHRYMAIKEIDNHPEVRDVDVDQRNCRFMDENYLDVHHYYSYTACSVQCRKNSQMRLCNCTHHLMPNTDFKYQCDIKGLACLNENYNELAVLKTTWANRTGLICNCMPSCTEMEMFFIKDDKNGIKEEHAIVELTLERLPSERFIRNVVRGKLDLVVSIGGSIALFMGASILSFVEIIYYFIIRPFSNYYSSNKDHQLHRKVKEIYNKSQIPFLQ